jgi:PAS domain S-box-containing protein
MSSIQRRPLWNAADLNPPFRIAIVACLVATMSYLAAKLGTTVVIRDTLEWPLWPGNILLVSALLYLPRRIWPIIIAAALVTFAFYDLRLGISTRSIIFYQLSDIAEVLIAALGLSYCFGGVPQLDSVKALAKYSFFAVLLAPFAGAFFSAFTTHGDYGRGWRIAFLSQALGYLTLIPAISGWVSKRSEWAHASLSRYLEASALLAGLALLGYYSFVSPSTIIAPVLIIVPFLLWAALRFGTTGVSSVAIVVAFLAIWGAVQGRGPFVGSESANNVPSIQVFLLFVAAPFMVLAVVVEEHKQSQFALRQSEDKLRLLLDSTGEGIYGIDLEERCTFCNPACLRALGYERVDELLGKNMHDLIHYARADGTSFPVEQCQNFRAVQAGEGIHVDDEVLWRANGTSFPAELWSYPQRRGQEVVGAVVAFIDITERKLAQEALASLSRRLIEAQEQERTRIARELHDDICQRLALLAIQLEQMQQNPPNLPVEVGSRMGELRRQTSEIATDVQSLSHELHSARLQYLGLAAAVRGFCQEFGEQQNVEIDFNTHGMPKSPLSADISLCLFRVVQEALHNSAKHSGVRYFEVRLWGVSGEIHLTVTDSGLGFDREAAKESRGIGLISMEERLKLVNGTLSIASQPKRGTTVHARVPLASGSDAVRVAG